MEQLEHQLWKSDLLHLQCEFQVHSNICFSSPALLLIKQLSQYKNVSGINEVWKKDLIIFNDRVYNGLLKLSLGFEAECELPVKQL